MDSPVQAGTSVPLKETLEPELWSFGLSAYLSKRRSVEEHLDFLVPHNLGMQPTRALLPKTQRESWGFKDREVNVAEIWFSSDGPSLKEIQVFSMVLIWWVTALPIYLSLALCLPTGHCEKQITLDSEARTQDEFSLLILNPSLCTADNVAFTSLWETWFSCPLPINDKALKVK